MKLSEAMMLGSTTVKMVAGDWNSCVLGAACNAMGVAKHKSLYETMMESGFTLADMKMVDGKPEITFKGCKEREETVNRRLKVVELWPWLAQWMKASEAPDWFQQWSVNMNMVISPVTTVKVSTIIVTAFDFFICEGKMTLEQLVDWVASVEPSCGECCEYECKCGKTELLAVEDEVAMLERMASLGAPLDLDDDEEDDEDDEEDDEDDEEDELGSVKQRKGRIHA